MKIIIQSFVDSLAANRSGLLLFSVLSLATLAVLAIPPTVTDNSTPDEALHITTRLSQSKLVQGDVSSLYLDVGITAPAVGNSQSPTRASDMIVVLDRSGSMSGANKMSYAKAAIAELLSRLTANDRFALISFSNQAIVHTPLASVDGDRREQLQSIVDAIQPGGGTNMSEGLIAAAKLLNEISPDRASKILLLSDGHANQGVTDLSGLSRIVQRMTQKESVLSTIGMGLDFNETLMSALADYGMGRYDYLENLAGLGDIFTHSLDATRNIFAANSSVMLNLPDGVELIDAAGYPISKENGKVIIKTGQLLGDHSKKFVMTFRVNATKSGDLSLGDMNLRYQVDGEKRQQALSSHPLLLTVVEPARRQEAQASIDKDVYQQSWLKNNFGLMQKKLSYWLREGNREKASEAIAEYRKELAKAEEQAAMPLVSDEFDDKLNEMESGVAETFSGNLADQQIKRKRAAKSIQLDAIKQQRVQNPKH